MQKWQCEMENVTQLMELSETDVGESAPPHSDPDPLARSQPRFLGKTKSGNWELWLDPTKGGMYYYNRSSNETRYSFSRAEIAKEEGPQKQ